MPSRSWACSRSSEPNVGDVSRLATGVKGAAKEAPPSALVVSSRCSLVAQRVGSELRALTYTPPSTDWATVNSAGYEPDLATGAVVAPSCQVRPPSSL